MTSPDGAPAPVPIAVLGCGLLGTSIAMVANRSGARVRGFDPDPDVLARSAERSGLEPAASAKEAVEGARLVFVCTPVPETAGVVATALSDAPDATVTDVASVKSQVDLDVQALARPGTTGRWVGGHPMAGSERSGPDNASAAMLDGAIWVLTPVNDAERERVEELAAWIEAAGARPVQLHPMQHDRGVAFVSHLPQVASTALMNLAVDEDDPGARDTLLLAAGGFRDLTRLAASNPALWAGILRANRIQLASALDAYIAQLGEIRDLLDEVADEPLEAALAKATAARRELSAKPQVKAGVAVLQILVPDRPGVFAELTAALGERDVNIEDFEIVHSPEGGRGSVHLTVAAHEADEAAAGLTDHGFESVRIA